MESSRLEVAFPTSAGNDEETWIQMEQGIHACVSVASILEASTMPTPKVSLRKFTSQESEWETCEEKSIDLHPSERIHSYDEMLVSLLVR